MSTEGIDIDLDRSTGIALVEFSRPPHNFFDIELIKGLADAYGELEDDLRCRVIVLASSGKNFCAGANFSGDRLTPEQAVDLYSQGARLFQYSVPVVAAIQGRVIGGGLGLALSADFRVATHETRFECTFSKLNLHHGFGLTVTLPAVVGQQRALELLYTGGEMRGDEARKAGLCDRVVPANELRSAANTLASDIAAAGPLAVRSIRRTMRGYLPATINAATEAEYREQSILFGTADFEEGVRAMAERRPPVWTGR
jgi:enoyl-CoA hydratase/carnithine racemase